MGSILGLGRSHGVGNGTPLQYSFLDNSMVRGAWWATVHVASKSQITIEQLSTDTYFWWTADSLYWTLPMVTTKLQVMYITSVIFAVMKVNL